MDPVDLGGEPLVLIGSGTRGIAACTAAMSR